MTRRILAVDPGGVHVGMAEFGDDGCTRAWELTPAEAPGYVREAILDPRDPIDVLVIEEFRLYPWLAAQQTYSDFPTVQLIGALKLVWATGGGQWWGAEGGELPILAMQPATIKDPTRSVLRGRGIKSVAKKLKAGGHAADAELHGWHYILREEDRVKQAAKKAGKNRTGKIS